VSPPSQPSPPRRVPHPGRQQAGRDTARKRYGPPLYLRIADLPPEDRDVCAAIIAAVRAKRAEQRAESEAGEP
jgi:hypothetical protein